VSLVNSWGISGDSLDPLCRYNHRIRPFAVEWLVALIRHLRRLVEGFPGVFLSRLFVNLFPKVLTLYF
jgi:hypothetical protein